jgi:DNA-binding PadR family transcriptional regulator
MSRRIDDSKQQVATEPQLEILKAMASGIELSADMSHFGMGVSYLQAQPKTNYYRKTVTVSQIISMEDKGLIRSRDQKARTGFARYRPVKRIWSLTAKGRREAERASTDSR